MSCCRAPWQLHSFMGYYWYSHLQEYTKKKKCVSAKSITIFTSLVAVYFAVRVSDSAKACATTLAFAGRSLCSSRRRFPCTRSCAPVNAPVHTRTRIIYHTAWPGGGGRPLCRFWYSMSVRALPQIRSTLCRVCVSKWTWWMKPLRSNFPLISWS